MGAIVTFIMALAQGSLAPPAGADGDPASDVLASQALFLPADARVAPQQQAQLSALLTEANRAGLELRVAVIASPADLGSIGELWRQPRNYARFLGQELSLSYRGPLLVVMPNGYGLHSAGPQEAALAGATTPGAALGSATAAAIQRLARAAGYPLSSHAAGAAQPRVGSSNAIPWIVFLAGLGVIVLAWAASLRARPLGAPRDRGRQTNAG